MNALRRIELPNGTIALFETNDEDYVSNHGDRGQEILEQGLDRLKELASSADQVCQTIRSRVTPDELQLELGIGLSGEVGWFFAKSTMDASIKLTLSWKDEPKGRSERPS